MTETAEQMHDRLVDVIARARFRALSEPYAWQPLTKTEWIAEGALAAVKDGEAWYALAPAARGATGTYRVLVFHFAEGTNASGFVTWLARLMKQDAETGAMVVCGFDARGTPALWQTSLGLFDYWGCPWSKGDEVIALVERLRRSRS
jgi:hypothetical protein